MNLTDRLRGVLRPQGRPQDPLHTCDRSLESSGAPADDAAAILGGEWRDAHGHQYLVVDSLFQAGYRFGRVAVADCLPDDGVGWPRLALLLMDPATLAPGRRLLFVDLETTGLAGGAGTYAFLVGCGWFDGAGFRVRQYVLTSFAAERALLEDVAALLGGSGALITFNGKSYDAPLIDSRFLFHRLEAPCADLPHVDLLHHARRLWRPSGNAHGGEPAASCRLSLVERSVLGHVRDDDVPGFEIPSRYFHFVRSGDARALGAVLEHNRLDLLALAMLTARAAQLLEEGAAGARSAREALGLGRLYERAGLMADARMCFARAVELDADAETQAEALGALAVRSRRERRYLEAADAWRRMLALRGCPPRLAHEATEALAIHHEHRSRDLSAARRFAVESLQFTVTRARAQAVHHRLARIDRKMGAVSTQAVFAF